MEKLTFSSEDITFAAIQYCEEFLTREDDRITLYTSTLVERGRTIGDPAAWGDWLRVCWLVWNIQRVSRRYREDEWVAVEGSVIPMQALIRELKVTRFRAVEGKVDFASRGVLDEVSGYWAFQRFIALWFVTKEQSVAALIDDLRNGANAAWLDIVSED